MNCARNGLIRAVVKFHLEAFPTVLPAHPPSQGWKTFLRNHADGIASMDLFVVPTLSFRLLYGLLIYSRPASNLMAGRDNTSDR